MRRLAIALFPLLVIASRPEGAHAQAPAAGVADEPPGPPPASDADITPTAPGPGGQLEGAAAATTTGAPTAVKRYEDIVVVPRKAFLKSGRLELAPFTGMIVNNPLVKHYSFGADLNYWLSDVFAIGLQGQYFVKERTDREGLVGLQYNRVSTLNKYIFSAALNFSYIPAYGKFTLFNKYIMHWEVIASAGAGVTQSEIIPRRVSDESFKSILVTPNFGLGWRFFLSNWLTFNVAIRDYVFSDKFEPLNRGDNESIESVKNRAPNELVNNITVYAGVGFYLPPSFDYRTPR